MESLKGKNIMVVGGTSGIGLEVVIQLHELGSNLCVVGRCKEKLHNLEDRLKNKTHRMLSFDVSKVEGIEDFLSSVRDHFEGFDGLVYCAGYDQIVPLSQQKYEKIIAIHNVNLFGAIEFSRVLTKKKYKNKTMSIVFLSSVMGQLGQPGLVGYCSTKGALQAIVRPMALELAEKGVRVNSIAPGVVQTPMSDQLFATLKEEAKKQIIGQHPLGLGKANDVANLIVFLLSDKSSWITGTNLTIDGGYCSQ